LNEWKDTLQSSGHANAMREVLKLIDNAISNTRSLTFDLSPPILYELGLEAGLESLLEQFHERHSIQFVFEDDNQDKPVEDEVRILLYRCVSELLMNVIKHSKAQLVKLSIRRENNLISITLEDDGIGFHIPEAEIGGEVQGFGLLSIRERLNWIGGSFKLQSNPGSGTYATLQAPLKYTENNTGRQI
jgi:signal transduction histidine kinase